MLFRGDARPADCPAKPGGNRRRQWSRILVGDHPGDCPCGRRMLGREGIPALPKLPPVTVLQRTLTAKGILQRVGCSKAVDRCLTSQESCFAHMIVMNEVSPQI